MHVLRQAIHEGLITSVYSLLKGWIFTPTSNGTYKTLLLFYFILIWELILRKCQSAISPSVLVFTNLIKLDLKNHAQINS